ncbi:isopentenyl-diphosphate Delta-isomerase [Patescibacteria group bacterium]|nr:isopentenyl-diphosphate Delta-isomerase [Patescibacteria group bacterium]
MPDDIILVDKNDQPIGTGQKMEVHKKGQLHRAFSILIFNRFGQLLLQKRVDSKYHCPGMWTNTCCSHPKPEEDTLSAAHRRLKEELGFDCDLEEKFSFIYKAEFDNGLTEHEYDHVFFGYYDDPVDFDKNEISDIKWLDIKTIKDQIKNQPDIYTDWFKIIISKYF